MERSKPIDYEVLLDNQRELIDEIDNKLVELINRRSSVVLEIGRIKMEHNLPIYVESREEQVLQRIEKNNEDGPIPQEEMRAIFQAIMKGSRAIQQRMHERGSENLVDR